MDPYVTEQEQLETLKKWWQKNGTSLLLTISAALALSGGYQYWHNQVTQGQLNASAQYTQMVGLLGQDKTNDAIALGDQLIQNFSDTPYAALASLAVAKAKLEKGDTTAARSHLIWVTEHSKSVEVKDIAQIRLARVFYAQKEYEQALKTLAKVTSTEMSPVMDEIKGDIYLVQGEREKARVAYQSVVNAKKANAKIAQLKLEDIGSSL